MGASSSGQIFTEMSTDQTLVFGANGRSSGERVQGQAPRRDQLRARGLVCVALLLTACRLQSRNSIYRRRHTVRLARQNPIWGVGQGQR